MKSIINSHNKNILKNDEKENKKCNCIKKEECPINNECLTTNIVYKANITSNLENQVTKEYIGVSETTFKKRYANHKKSFNHVKYESDTELSNEFWKIKKMQGTPTVTFSILKMCPPYNPSTKTCTLCTNEKLFILENKSKNLMNTRNELVPKCRHSNKHKLCNHKT